MTLDEGTQTLIVTIILAACVVWIVVRAVKAHRSGKSSCCDDACGGCKLKEACNQKKGEKD